MPIRRKEETGVIRKGRARAAVVRRSHRGNKRGRQCTQCNTNSVKETRKGPSIRKKEDLLKEYK